MNKTLINLVKEEAKFLKENLTRQEKSNINYDYLNPDRPTRCIYGLATGNCNSKRAVRLMRKGCSRVFSYKNITTGYLDNCTLNGSPKGHKRQFITKKGYEGFWSPIEVFIYKTKRESNKVNLVNYITDVTNKLTLK